MGLAAVKTILIATWLASAAPARPPPPPPPSPAAAPASAPATSAPPATPAPAAAPAPAPSRAAPPAQPDPSSTEGLSVAVFPLEPKHGVPPGVAELVTENMLVEVRRTGAFARVVSPADISVLMPPEQQRFLQKCASDDCAVVDNELAGALGVSHILVGNIGKLGNSFLLNLRLLDVRTSVLVASLSDRARGDTEEALLDAVKPAVKDLLQQARLGPAAASSTTPSSTAAPAAASTGGPSLARKALWGVAGTVLVITGLVVLGALGMWAGAGAVAAFDFASGWRPGGIHALTATQALLANVVLGAAIAGTVLGLLAGTTGAVLFAASGFVP